MVISSKSSEMEEKAIIWQEPVARSLYYYAKFDMRSTGLLCVYETEKKKRKRKKEKMKTFRINIIGP